MVERLKQWFLAERQKMTGYSLPDLAAYIWEYYKLWIIGIVSAVLFLGWFTANWLTVPKENWFFACFGNTYASLGNRSAFHGGFVRYAGYDLREKNLEFNNNIYCRPSNFNDVFTNEYYQSLIAFIDSGTLDVLVMEQQEIEALGRTGRLLDLEDERLGDFAARWADKLVYVEPDDEAYGKDQVPIGVDLAGSMLVGEYCAYPDGAVLGVNALAPHLDQVEIFLTYLFEETMPA